MAGCIAGTAYTMKIDIYQPTISQDATGAVIKVWSFEKTINCYVRGIITQGLRENSVSMSINEYINTFNSIIKLRSQEVIPTNRRVVRIRNSSGVIFLENQDVSTDGGFQGSTIFEPRGSTPLVNFDGSVVEYETVLTRQEIQRIDV